MKRIILLPALVFSWSIVAQAQNQTETASFQTKSKIVKRSNKKTDLKEETAVVPVQEGFGTMSLGKNQVNNSENTTNLKNRSENNSFSTKAKLTQEQD